MKTKTKKINWYEAFEVEAENMGSSYRGKWQCFEWEITLTVKGNKNIKPFNTSFFTGMAIAGIRKFDVLYSLVSDAISYLNSKPNDATFDHYKHLDNFSAELGYDKPSLAIKAFEGCKKQYEYFRSFMSDNEIYSLEEYIRDYEDKKLYENEEYL